jgi:hypothetical protein
MTYAERQVNWKIILEGFLFMEHALNRIRETAREERLTVGAIVIKHIKRKAKSESAKALNLRLFFKHINKDVCVNEQ